MNAYAQSSSFLSSPPGRCGCPPRRRCSGPACHPSACNSLRSRLQSSTRHRRRGRSSAARSVLQNARPGTSLLQWQVSFWSPSGSRGCSGCLQGLKKVVKQILFRKICWFGLNRVSYLKQPTCVFSGRFSVPGFNDQRKCSLKTGGGKRISTRRVRDQGCVADVNYEYFKRVYELIFFIIYLPAT